MNRNAVHLGKPPPGVSIEGAAQQALEALRPNAPLRYFGVFCVSFDFNDTRVEVWPDDTAHTVFQRYRMAREPTPPTPPEDYEPQHLRTQESEMPQSEDPPRPGYGGYGVID